MYNPGNVFTHNQIGMCVCVCARRVDSSSMGLVQFGTRAVSVDSVFGLGGDVELTV